MVAFSCRLVASRPNTWRSRRRHDIRAHATIRAQLGETKASTPDNDLTPGDRAAFAIRNGGHEAQNRVEPAQRRRFSRAGRGRT
jgi:hypothetical protein